MTLTVRRLRTPVRSRRVDLGSPDRRDGGANLAEWDCQAKPKLDGARTTSAGADAWGANNPLSTRGRAPTVTAKIIRLGETTKLGRPRPGS